MVEARKVDGVDLSHWNQQGINWGMAKDAGLKWLYHKATEGNTVTDSWYSRRRAEAAAHDVPFGAYHFARPERGDAEREARHFLNIAGIKPGDLAPALDLETQGDLNLDELKHWVATWLAVVEKAVGHKAVLYTPYNLGEAIQKGRVLWRPRYNDSNTPPELGWDIWQFSNGVFGRPNSVAGIGKVDLNTHAKDFDWRDRMLILRPEPEPTSRKVRMAHCSMRYDLTDKQMETDIIRLFARAVERNTAWLTGTEAGGKTSKPMPRLLKTIAERHGYRFHFDGGDCWLAVRKDILTAKPNWREGFTLVIVASEGAGKHTNKGLTWASFDTKDLGRVSVGVGHYLTNGKREGEPNYSLNRRYARAIGKWGRVAGRGAAIVFYHGDQNIQDRTDDTFLGQPFTSSWDELKEWDGTGHGNIDVIASYDRDARVLWVATEAFTDKEFPLHTDHFLVEAVAEIKVAK